MGQNSEIGDMLSHIDLPLSIDLDYINIYKNRRMKKIQITWKWRTSTCSLETWKFREKQKKEKKVEKIKYGKYNQIEGRGMDETIKHGKYKVQLVFRV